MLTWNFVFPADDLTVEERRRKRVIGSICEEKVGTVIGTRSFN